MNGKLSGRQERFCAEYINDLKRNQRQAALRAGYSDKGAAVEASRMLKNPNILRRIKELEREALEEAGYSLDSLRLMVMRELVSQATTNVSEIVSVVYAGDEQRQAAIAQMIDANGGQGIMDFGEAMMYIKPTSEWTPEQRAAVRSIEQTKEGIKLGTYDKLAALRLLTDITGLTKADVNVNLSVTECLTEARQRVMAGVENGGESTG
jgi:phage terminase small subunit